MASPDWKDVVLRQSGGAEVRAFFGYLVESSSEDGRARLYLSPDLNEYLEIPRQHIVHREDLDHDEHPLGGSYVWVKASARLRRVGRKTVEGQADFLRGEIEEEHRREAEMRLGTGWRNPVTTGYLCTEYTVCTPCASYGLCRGGGRGDPSPE
jgi:hypothetical protein